MTAESRAAAAEVSVYLQLWLGDAFKADYAASVKFFALRLPPVKLREALIIAMCCRPRGGRRGFLFFSVGCQDTIDDFAANFSRN